MTDFNEELQKNITIGIYSCDSVKGIEDNIINNKLTQGKEKGDSYFKIEYSYINNLYSKNECEKLEFIIILASKEELLQINHKYIKYNKIHTIAFIIDNHNNKFIDDLSDNIDSYVIAENKEGLVLATQSFIDALNKDSYIGVDFNESFLESNKIMYFKNFNLDKINEIEHDSFFKKVKDSLNVISIIYLNTEDFGLLRYMNIVDKVNENLNDKVFVYTYLYESLDESLEQIRLFACIS